MKLDNFLPYLLVELPGVSDPLVRQALVRTAIEFCQMTQCWREPQEPIPLVDGRADYDLDSPTDAQVFLLRQAWVGQRPLRPLNLQRMQLELPSDASLGSPNPTHFLSSVDRQSLTLYPTPMNRVDATPLRVEVCHVPKATATNLPDILGERYLMAVGAGTKAYLMSMPGQPWSQPALSDFYRAQFDAGVVAAKIEAVYDVAINGRITVAPRRLGF